MPVGYTQNAAMKHRKPVKLRLYGAPKAAPCNR
jgi:hypothetical protein